MGHIFVVSVVFIIGTVIDSSIACNGYKMRIISMENCLGADQVVQIDANFTSHLSDDCILTNHGCITTRGFKQAKIKYSIKIEGNEIMKGHPDVCSILDKKNEEHKAKLQMFGFPTECPLSAGRKCVDPEKKIDISKFKSLLPMAVGNVTAHYDITHDTGKTCIHVQVEIYK